MSKTRIVNLAKELSVDVREIIQLLKDKLGLQENFTYLSSLDEVTVVRVRQFIGTATPFVEELRVSENVKRRRWVTAPSLVGPSRVSPPTPSPERALDGKEARIARKKVLVARLENAFKLEFLSADEVLAADPDVTLINDEEYANLKVSFVQDWAARELQQPLDFEQASAVAATGGDIQVVARAGGGKTRTLVTRAIFLQKHCGISPCELLLLAFNDEAATQMKNKLARVLGGDLPHVMNFHQLAHALVKPKEDLLSDDKAANQPALSREVQKIIDKHKTSQEYVNRIRDLMLAHFREDWERIEKGSFHMNMEELLAHRRALPRESLKGDYVKSFGEKVIANALFENGVEYQYERLFHWKGDNYRPDFTIPFGLEGGLIIEYFGLEGDGDYDEMSQEKRRYWSRRNEWKLIEFSPKDLLKNGVDDFGQLLLERLQKEGISYQRRSEEEIWKLVKKRALGGFTSAMEKFIGRCRQQNLSPEDLKSMVDRHSACSTAEAIFLDIGVSVYRGYLQRIAADNKEDFSGLMWRSVSQIREGKTSFVRDSGKEQGDVARLRFVMIDEYQDFSEMFFALVNAIRSVNPSAQFFCVGDNWQAIYGFAGSDLRFFDDFADYFRDTSRCYIHKNYRSPVSVVELSNALMDGQGEKAKPGKPDSGWVRLCKLDEFTPSALEHERHKNDAITPALLRLVRGFLHRGQDVVMLSRTNDLPWVVKYDDTTNGAPDGLIRFEKHIRSYLPQEDRERVTCLTIHRYKGSEKAAVVVLDAVKRRYPLIHPNWLFLRVFGDSIGQKENEERRLFYVAATRAKYSLALLTETSIESPYIGDIRQQVHLGSLSWADLPSMPSPDGARFEIRVFNAYGVMDQLIVQDYLFQDAKNPYWHKTMLAEGFSFDTLLSQPWAKQNVGIGVYSETGELLYRNGLQQPVVQRCSG